MRNSLDDIKRTLEKIRKEKYPDIPKEIIEKIVMVQAENQDNASKRQTETERVIDDYLQGIGQGGGTL